MNNKRKIIKLNYTSSALLVIDMQNDFVLQGAIMEVPDAKKQVPKIKELIIACREKKIPIIYTKHETDPNICALEILAFPQLKDSGMRKGTLGIEIVDELKPKKGDYIITKNRFSAFYNTNLDIILKGLNIDTLLICGTVSNICCESTARDAFYRDYKVVFVDDCCSSLTKEAHSAVLENMKIFGTTKKGEEIIKCLMQG